MNKRRTSESPRNSSSTRSSQHVRKARTQYGSGNPGSFRDSRGSRSSGSLQKAMNKRRQEKLRQQRRKRNLCYGILAAITLLVFSLTVLGISRLLPDRVRDGAEQVSEDSGTQVTTTLSQPEMNASGTKDFFKEITLRGWQSDSQGIRYIAADGTSYGKGWHDIDGSQYYFDENGYVKTGWHDIDGKDCYFDESGKYDSEKVRPMIALTFDDGPGKYTEELLECLEENNAKATFFMLGQNAERYPNTVKHMEKLGMELANHTYDHPILTNLSSTQISNEIEKTSRIIERIAGKAPASMRPPGGAFNHTVRSVSGLPIIMWSIDTKDWKTKSEDMTYRCVMDNARDGSVVLMHDIHQWSAKAAIRMIPELVAKGFKLVTVEELARAKGITLENGKAYYYFGEGTQQVE